MKEFAELFQKVTGWSIEEAPDAHLDGDTGLLSEVSEQLKRERDERIM